MAITDVRGGNSGSKLGPCPKRSLAWLLACPQYFFPRHPTSDRSCRGSSSCCAQGHSRTEHTLGGALPTVGVPLRNLVSYRNTLAFAGVSDRNAWSDWLTMSTTGSLLTP